MSVDLHLRERSVPPARVRMLALVSVLAALLFAATYVLAVRTERGQRLDDTALARSTSLDRPRVDRATEGLLTTISVGSIAVIGGGIVLVALGRGRIHLAVAAGVVIGGSIVSAEALKRVVLERPHLVDLTAGSVHNSYPSGHTTVAASLALASVLVAPRRARPVVGLVGGAYALGIAEAVMFAGWHRPSDPIGSFLLVLVWATVVGAWLAATHARLVRGEHGGTALLGPALAVLGACVLAVSFALAATAAGSWHTDRLDALDLGGAALTAAALIATVGVVVFTTFVTVLGGLTVHPSDPRAARRARRWDL